MKKHFKLLFTITSFVSVLGSLCSCDKSEINVSDNAFNDTNGITLTKARSLTRDFSPSSERVNDAIVHTTVNSATTKKYIRYAFPVDCVDIEHLSITRTIDSDSKKVTINTVYKKIAYEGKEYFYNPSVNGMLSETDPGNGFYFACYCVEVSSSSLNKNIAANVEADYELGAPIVGATTKTSYDVISNGVSNQATVRFFDTKNKEIEKQIITKGSAVSAPALSDITCWLSNGNVWSSGSTVSSDLDITAHKCKELHLSPAKEATCTGTGYKEHYRCATCQTCFEDSAGTRRIDNLETWKTGAGKINPLGHNFDFANKVVTWNNDVATATAHCINPNCSESVTETKQGSYVRDTIGSCTVHERGHYAVTFTDTRLGNAATETDSIDRGLVHNFGDLIPQVDAHRETAGTKAHYHCSSCGGYFDADHNPISASSLVIPAPARHFAANTNMNFDFDEPIAITETITVDVKLINPTSSSKVNFALFGEKEGGGSDWENYFGYFAVRLNGVDSYPGVSQETLTDDGYFRIKINLSQVTRVNNANGGTPSFSAINGLYVRGGDWTDVEGSIEVNSNVLAHTKGTELIPAKAAVHGEGYQAHYECTGCDDYWFDESGALCKKEDLTIASKAVKFAPPTSGNTIGQFNNLGNIADKISLDIHFDNPETTQEIGINFYETVWENYYGTFWVVCDSAGVHFKANDNQGITLDELTDGWWRVTAYPSALNRFVQDNKDVAQKHSIDFIWIKASDTIANRGSGMFELNSEYEGTVPSTKVYSLSGESYIIDRTFLKGDIINLDVKIKNNTKINFALLTGWSSCFTFNIKPDGTLEDQKNGVQVFKLNNELAGYPTLEGTWYRVIINTSYIAASPDFVTINRIGGNKWNAAEFDMMINSPYKADGWYTIAGGSTNTAFSVKAPNPLDIRDSDNNLLSNKAIYFEVKATGTGKVYFSLMDYESKNMGKYVLTFTNSVLTDCVVQGSANKWPTVTNVGNGVYGLTLALNQFPGDGLNAAKNVGFFYATNGQYQGVEANGVTEFSINLLSLNLVDIL